MARVYFNVSGDGYAYTDAVPPLVDGETFTIYCIPYAGATLDDVRVWTSYDESIAIVVSQEISLTYNSAWNNVYVEVYFSGGVTPPIPPTPPTPAQKFTWLIAKVSQDWRKR